MIKFIRKHEKQLMALFGVFLMISFVATLGPSSCGGRYGPVSRETMGQIGTDKVTRDEVQQAQTEWDFMYRNLVLHSDSTGQAQWQPMVMAMMPAGFAQQMSETPEMYYLLQYEARQMGLAPQFSEADALLADSRVAVMTVDRRIVPFQNLNDEQQEARVRQSVANLLMVQSAYRRANDAIKVSSPMIKHELAQQLQQVKARVVDFPAKQFESRLSSGTDDQLKQQFSRFADVEADAVYSPTNPFGFGYKYPNRIKLQYIEIPRAEVRKFVQSTRSDYDWDFEANKYYLQHQTEFPTTQPASTQESLSLGPTLPTTRTSPSTRPFAEVREQILTRMIEAQVDRLANQLQSDLTARLNLDYDQKWLKPRSGPALTGGATSTPADRQFQAFEYLQGLAQDYQNRYHVTLTVVSATDSFLSSKELMNLQGIGSASSFAQIAIGTAEAFVDASQKDSPNVLGLFKPSKPLTDSARNVYIFRITDADPAHKPKDVSEVRELVERDWKLQQSFEMARAEAQKALDAARGPGLDAAADGNKVSTTGAFSLNPGLPVQGYNVTGRAETEFIRAVRDLMGTLANKDHSRPLALVDMPTEQKVAVVELIAVESNLKPENLELVQSLFADQILQGYQMAVAANWYDFDSIVQRLHYQQEETGRTRRPARAAIP